MFGISFLGYGVALVLGLISLLYWYASQAQQYWKKKGIPTLKSSIIFGHLKDVVLRKVNFGHKIKDIYNKMTGERYVGVYFFQRPILVLRDPELIKTVLVKDFHHFEDHNVFLNEEVDALRAKHLFSLKGQRWRNMRMKLTPTFTSGKMKKMFHLVCECTQELQDYLEKPSEVGASVELKDVIAKLTTDVIATCAFGIQVNSLKNPDAEFRKMGRKIMDNPSFIQGLKRFLVSTNPIFRKLLKVATLAPEVTQFFRNVVRETMEYREAKGIVRNDFMDLLIQLKNKGKVDDDDEKVEGDSSVPENIAKQELSQDDLTAQAFVFFVGGFETSSSVISLTLYELAINPKIQKTLRDEIDEVLKKNDGEVTYQAVMHDMTYLDKVVSETLRKYPPLSVTDRRCTKPYNIPNTNITLDVGAVAQIPILALHYDPRFFPNPEKFDPERFNEEEKTKRPNYCYLPFGEGPRQCIGLRFGLMQTKTCLVSLLSKYEFKLSEKTVVPFVQDPASFLTSARYGTWVKIVKRSDT